MVTIIYFGYNYIKKEFKVYNEGDIVGYINNIAVKSSYFNIDDGKTYVIVSFDVSKYGIDEKLNVNNLELLVDGKEYLPNKNICNKFNYLGVCYKKQYITNDIKNYIITYQVDGLDIKKTYLVYKEGYDISYKIKLNLENYD